MVNTCKQGFKKLGNVCVSKKKFRDKTTTGFDTALTFYSLFGFLAIVLIWLFAFDITEWAIPVLMVSAGIAFLYDGNIRRILADRKIESNEIAGFVTVVIGALAIIVGILSIPLFEIQSATLIVVTGIIALISIVTIVIQRWII